MSGETVIASYEGLENVSKLFSDTAQTLETNTQTWRTNISVFTKPTGSDTTSQMLAKIYDVLHTSSDRFTDIVKGLHGLSTDLHTMGVNYLLTEQANKS